MAVNTIYFGTNRDVTGPDDAPRFGDGHNREKPYFYRVGEVGVTKRGEPWADGDRAYEAGGALLYAEHPAEAGAEALLGSTRLFEGLRETMRDNPRDAIVFIHGFANSFESAMERAAELRDAYLSPMTDPETGVVAARGREPMVFAFSWPSDARLLLGEGRAWAYSGDREDARASGQAMARAALRLFDYLAGLAEEERCLQRVHLVAHSMGNWALRHAVQALVDIAGADGRRLRRVFDHVFLMAADIEDDALERGNWLAPLFDLGRRVHVYHAENDRALTLSDVKPNQGARLGHLGPARIAALPDRVTAVDCAEVSDTPADPGVRHQYYRLAPEVVRDVRAVLAEKAPREMPWRVALDGGRRVRIRRDRAAREKLGG